jgi:hypothetical protein
MLMCGVWLCAAGWPESAAAQDLIQRGVIEAPAGILEIGGRQAYAVDGRTLAVFDLSKPEHPVRKGSYTFPDKIWGIKAVGSLVYAAVDKYGLGILDVSASPPTLRGSFKTPGQSKSVAIVGTTALVADHMSGVNFVDVSDPAKPEELGEFFLDGYARAVASTGTIAVAVDAPAGLYVFDFSKPDRLEPISTQQSAERPGNVYLSNPSEAGGRRLAVLVGNGALQIYDLAKPEAPVKAATFRTPGGRPQSVALRGTLAYVADGRSGVQIVDLADPSTPRLVGSFSTPAPARAVAANESLVLVSVGRPPASESAEATDGRVLILSRRDPSR